jgi:hypothetical protein
MGEDYMAAPRPAAVAFGAAADGRSAEPALGSPPMRRVAEDVFQIALLRATGPDLVLFGHGPPLPDPTVFKEFADALPK